MKNNILNNSNNASVFVQPDILERCTKQTRPVGKPRYSIKSVCAANDVFYVIWRQADHKLNTFCVDCWIINNVEDLTLMRELGRKRNEIWVTTSTQEREFQMVNWAYDNDAYFVRANKAIMDPVVPYGKKLLFRPECYQRILLGKIHYDIKPHWGFSEMALGCLSQPNSFWRKYYEHIFSFKLKDDVIFDAYNNIRHQLDNFDCVNIDNYFFDCEISVIVMIDYLEYLHPGFMQNILSKTIWHPRIILKRGRLPHDI